MPDPKKTTGKPIIDEIATTAKDIDVFAGWLRRLENPDPVLSTEAAGKGLKLYDEVARDAHASSVLQTRYLAVAGREWEVLPASDSDADAAVADFVREAIEGVNFSLAVQEMLQAVLYGFYSCEVMWTVRAGAWVPSALMGKHPRRFSFDMDRHPRLLTPENMIEGEPLPERKFIVFTWGSSDNPYGTGLGQKLWWPVWFKKHGIKWWLVFLEKFGMPTSVGKYPPGTPPDQQKALLDAIEAIQAETGVKIPDTMTIELLEAVRVGNAGYEKLAEYMDRQISKAVLGQTATTEGTPGKLGNEKEQGEVRADIIKADADLLCETISATLVRWIVDLNLPAGTDYPKLWIRTDAEQDLKALAERDNILVNEIGVRVPPSYFYTTYNLPQPEDGEDIVSPASDAGKLYEYHLKYQVASINEIRAKLGLPPVPGGDRVPQAPEAQAADFAEAGRFTPDQQAIERLVESVLPGAAGARDRITADILAAVEQAESWEDMQILLAEMLADEAAGTDLAEQLTQAMTAANLWGRYAER